MKVIGSVDKVNFGMMMEHLKKVTGLSFKKIVRAQAKIILNHAVKNTPKASVAEIVKRYYPESLIYRKGTGKLKYLTLKDSGIAYPLSDADNHFWYYPNKIWRKILKQSRESVKKRADRRGLQASQFYLMGKTVGIDVNAKQFVKKASQYIAGSARGAEKGRLDYELTLKSLGVKANTSGIAKYRLESAIEARQLHYKTAIEKGVMKRLGAVKSQFGLK